MRLILGCLLVVAACGGDSGGDPNGNSDAGASLDATSINDAPGSPSGLRVSWDDTPAIPGTFGTGVMVTSVKLRIGLLHVIGDAGIPELTTRMDFDVVWSAATGGPFDLQFPNAEPALYSQISLQLDGEGIAPSYEILGTVMNGGTPEPFKISDTAQVPLDITGYSAQLFPGGAVELPIRVQIQKVIDAVDLRTARLAGNPATRTIDQSDTTTIPLVRAALDTDVFDTP